MAFSHQGIGSDLSFSVIFSVKKSVWIYFFFATSDRMSECQMVEQALKKYPKKSPGCGSLEVLSIKSPLNRTHLMYVKVKTNWPAYIMRCCVFFRFWPENMNRPKAIKNSFFFLFFCLWFWPLAAALGGRVFRWLIKWLKWQTKNHYVNVSELGGYLIPSHLRLNSWLYSRRFCNLAATVSSVWMMASLSSTWMRKSISFIFLSRVSVGINFFIFLSRVSVGSSPRMAMTWHSFPAKWSLVDPSIKVPRSNDRLPIESLCGLWWGDPLWISIVSGIICNQI